ncbi:zinc finger B-box domain-containing protein 1 [Tiliqua scincoides]|uniref:zinc finger B-box domain-containing protein 1 n=1 Tax=Tiliqua scincoides TaxID=71010 RepID=UPI003461FCB4
MNINDFVILPGSKSGFSVKLKAKSVRELQLEKVQLELENKEMEKRLQQLQSNMSREKQERERANGYHWRTGQSGFSTQPQLLSHNKENVGKVSSGKVKLRLLKEQVEAPEPAKKSFAHKVANAAAVEKPRLKGKACGQCETKMALLVCLECAEDYCPGCFARVHQKGALKLHRTTSLQAKARVPIRKLEPTQQFLKKINLDESNEARPASQNGGSLLQGTFDEEESAKSFQEAVNQWRSGSPSQKSKEERSCPLGSENTDTCEVQTSPPITKKSIDFEFKEDSLKYMERLLLKKHRRTPIDKLPDAVIESELNLEKPFINEDYDTWAAEEDDDDDDDDIANARVAAEEMKMCWANHVQPEDPEVVVVNSEPSLKIKILEEACKEELEESTNFVVVEAGSDDFSGTMSAIQKTEPDFLPHADDIPIRSSLSSSVERENGLTFINNNHGEATRASLPSAQSAKPNATHDYSSAKVIDPSTLHERAIMKEKCTTMKSNGSHTSSEHTSSPPELPPSEPFPAMELLKGGKMSPELNEVSPGTIKSSVVALREKCLRAPYQGLEGFFTMHASSQQVKMYSFPSRHTGSQSPSSSISFSGSERWTRRFSFSECANESIVQDVLKRELGRPSSRLRRQRPSSGASLLISSIALQMGVKSSVTWPLTRAASEISEIEGIDITEHDDPFLESSTDQQALSDLESELQSNADPLEECDLTSGDLSAFSRHLPMTSQNHIVFYNNHEAKDYSRGDSIRVFDESHTDDEEDLLRDKQEVSLSHSR